MSKITFTRQYGDYQAYLDHQSVKSANPEFKAQLMGLKWESRYNWFYAKFRRTLKEIGWPRSPHGQMPTRAALCLGARYGHEVKALIDLGYAALGIDIVECEPYVIPGDIHALQFPDQSQKLIFTNIFDHSIDPQKFADEIFRVLRLGGVAIIHLAVAKSTDEYGVIEIPTSQPIIDLFRLNFRLWGVKVLINRAFPRKWGGLNWELVIKREPMF